MYCIFEKKSGTKRLINDQLNVHFTPSVSNLRPQNKNVWYIFSLRLKKTKTLFLLSKIKQVKTR